MDPNSRVNDDFKAKVNKLDHVINKEQVSYKNFNNASVDNDIIEAYETVYTKCKDP